MLSPFSIRLYTINFSLSLASDLRKFCANLERTGLRWVLDHGSENVLFGF